MGFSAYISFRDDRFVDVECLHARNPEAELYARILNRKEKWSWLVSVSLSYTLFLLYDGHVIYLGWKSQEV